MASPTPYLTAYLNKQQSLEATYKKVKRHVDARAGIIPRVYPVPTPYARNVFHIYIARHPVLGQITSLSGLLANIKSTSSAIGKTPRQARLLAICEALERWSCVSQGGEFSIQASYNDLGPQAIKPDFLHGFSVNQYANRKMLTRLNPTGGGFIPEPFDPEQKVQWCPAFDLVDKTWKYVLKSSCYFGHHDNCQIYSVADSRGVAAGPNREFCVWNALLELIETDAGAIWNANQLTRPGVDIESFNNPYLLELIKTHHQLDRDVWALDISMDIAGVVVFVVCSRDRQSGNVIKGFGAHPLAHQAMEKAMLECCQMLPNVIKQKSNPTSDLQSTEEAVLLSQKKEHTNHHYFPDPGLTARKAKDYPDHPSIYSIHGLVQTLLASGITPLVQDVSRPELGLCVMRVWGPGMRSWFDRRGPGRLYDVPVKMGLRVSPQSEEALNPIPVEG